MVEISTSVLTVEKDKIIKTIYNLETAKTDFFHIDVMDGKFVESFTSGIMEEYCEYMKSISNIPLDVHLMVKDVKKYIDKFLVFEPNVITFHIEAVKDVNEAIKLFEFVKENNCKVGIAINPETDISKILELIKFVHVVNVMTVVPGKGGQKLIEDTLDKVKQLRNFVDENNLDVFIETDGGINLSNVEKVKASGADIIVSGNGIISSENYADVIKKMKFA